MAKINGATPKQIKKGIAAGDRATTDVIQKRSVQVKAAAKTSGVKPEAFDNSNTVKVNSNPVPTRTSPSLSQGGRLGGAHAGGQGISEEEMFAGKGPSKLGGLGALGARIARATEGEVPLP